jgi:hypothetical protein
VELAASRCLGNATRLTTARRSAARANQSLRRVALGRNRDAKATPECPSIARAIQHSEDFDRCLSPPVSVEVASNQACSPDQRYAAPRAEPLGLCWATEARGRDWRAHFVSLSSLYCNGKPEREGFEPSWRVTPPTAFPGLGTGVQGRAYTGIAYSESRRRGHHEAGGCTRVGTPLGLVSGAPGLSSRQAERTFQAGGRPSNPDQVTGRSCGREM